MDRAPFVNFTNYIGKLATRQVPTETVQVNSGLSGGMQRERERERERENKAERES